MSSKDWEEVASPLSSGFVVSRPALASVRAVFNTRMPFWEFEMLDWILWYVPMELLNP
jgi:hypothetical protein